jgi:quercetin dioxygenase-like cupin family protein
MKEDEVGKSKPLRLTEKINYSLNSVLSTTIIKKITGNVIVASYDSGQTRTERLSRFDNFVQIIDGRAEIVIDGISSLLETGDAIIIPAHSMNSINAIERFKMISTIIKSGYEDVI